MKASFLVSNALDKFGSISESVWSEKSLKAGSLERRMLQKVDGFFTGADLFSDYPQLNGVEVVIEAKNRTNESYCKSTKWLAYQHGTKVVICRRALAKSEQTLVPILVHELVHVTQYFLEFKAYAKTSEQKECQAYRVEAMVGAFFGFPLLTSPDMNDGYRCYHQYVATEISTRTRPVLSENAKGKKLYFKTDIMKSFFKNDVAGKSWGANLDYPAFEVADEASENIGLCTFTVKDNSSTEAMTTPALITNVSTDFINNHIRFELDHPVFAAITCTLRVYPILSDPVFSHLTKGNGSLTPFKD